MDLFDRFATDEEAEINGAKIKVPGTKEGYFLVARGDNPDYQRALAAAVEANQDLLGAKNSEADKAGNRIFAEVMAKHILRGWGGDLTFKKKPLPEYSREVATQYLEMKEFRKYILRLADDIENYRAKYEEEQGNV